jgi:hypothetical protein
MILFSDPVTTYSEGKDVEIVEPITQISYPANESSFSSVKASPGLVTSHLPLVTSHSPSVTSSPVSPVQSSSNSKPELGEQRESREVRKSSSTHTQQRSGLKPWRSMGRLPQATIDIVDIDINRSSLPRSSDDNSQQGSQQHALPADMSSWRFFDLAEEKRRWMQWHSQQEQLRYVSAVLLQVYLCVLHGTAVAAADACCLPQPKLVAFPIYSQYCCGSCLVLLLVICFSVYHFDTINLLTVW